MIPRYSRPQMAAIWEPENYFRIQLDIEHPVHGELRVDFVDQRIFGSMARAETSMRT